MTAARFDPAGRLVFVGTANGQVLVFNTRTKMVYTSHLFTFVLDYWHKHLQMIARHRITGSGGIRGLAFAKHGRYSFHRCFANSKLKKDVYSPGAWSLTPQTEFSVSSISQPILCHPPEMNSLKRNWNLLSDSVTPSQGWRGRKWLTALMAIGLREVRLEISTLKSIPI